MLERLAATGMGHLANLRGSGNGNGNNNNNTRPRETKQGGNRNNIENGENSDRNTDQISGSSLDLGGGGDLGNGSTDDSDLRTDNNKGRSDDSKGKKKSGGGLKDNLIGLLNLG